MTMITLKTVTEGLQNETRCLYSSQQVIQIPGIQVKLQTGRNPINCIRLNTVVSFLHHFHAFTYNCHKMRQKADPLN